MLYTEELEERRGGEAARIERTRRKGSEKEREGRMCGRTSNGAGRDTVAGS